MWPTTSIRTLPKRYVTTRTPQLGKYDLLIFFVLLLQDNTRNLIRIQNQVPKQHILSPSRKFIMEASYPTNYFDLLKKSAKKREEKSKNKERRDGSERTEDELWETKEKREKKRNSISSSSLRALDSDSGFVQSNLYLFDDMLAIQSTKDKGKSASLRLNTTWIRTQAGKCPFHKLYRPL